MEGTTEFFFASHKRVLNIATWARYLAWVALVIGVLGMAVSALQTWNSYQISQTMGVSHQVSSDLEAILRNDPFFLFKILVGMARALFSGVFYYVILRGISLGLNMIVETDVNYREKKEQGGVQ